MNHSTIYLLHILAVAPLLIYVGYMGKKCDQMCFNLLLVLGVIVLLYHLMGYFNQKKDNDPVSTPVHLEKKEDNLPSQDDGLNDNNANNNIENNDEYVMVNNNTSQEENQVEGFSW